MCNYYIHLKMKIFTAFTKVYVILQTARFLLFKLLNDQAEIRQSVKREKNLIIIFFCILDDTNV